MSNAEDQKPSIKNFGPLKRKAVSMAQDGLINQTNLAPDRLLPLVVQPATEGLNLIAWASSNLEFIEIQLLKYGGILFRNFTVRPENEFERLITVISGDLVEYNYRSTPRSRISGKIYTSTEYPADQSIPLHNEMAYSKNWPMKIWFFCLQPAESGGETPIADSRKVFERIDPRIKERFLQKNVMYIRNYGDGLDLPWQNVFQTSNKSEVEDYCRRDGIKFEWKDGNRLTTRQVCQGVAAHPKTGQKVWFNQAHLFHVSSLEPQIQQSLLSAFSPEQLPRNAFYGDGSPIEASVIQEIREVYEQEAITFSWEKGDILMLDNMLTAHGRRPYRGPRKIMVGMAEPFTGSDNSNQVKSLTK